MALSLDPATQVITIPQADLTLVSGTLYELDTNEFRKNVMALLDDEDYIWLPNPFIHNTEVTVAGTTFARTIEFINGYSIEFEDGTYSVRLAGSNNNIFDVENGILVQNQVQVIAQNSAGLIVGETGGLLDSDLAKIADHVLRRSTVNVEGSSDGDALSLRSLYGMIAQAVHNTDISGTTLTVRQSDDSTTLGTRTVTTDANAEAITGIDTD